MAVKLLFECMRVCEKECRSIYFKAVRQRALLKVATGRQMQRHKGLKETDKRPVNVSEMEQQKEGTLPAKTHTL